VFTPDAERLPADLRRRLQSERLGSLIRRLAPSDSPYWRMKLEGVDPATIHDVDDLPRLPFTTKDELKQNQTEKPPWGDVLAVPMEDVTRVHLTSATTGRPLAFLDTREDWYGFYRSYARSLYAFGVRSSDMVMAAWGFECAERSGLTHVHEDYCYPEVLGDDDQPVRPGERGELVLTNLYRKAMPLLRYRTRDLVQLADRPCPCGRTLLSFEGGVLGRLDDMKKVRGIIVYPRRIEEIVRPHGGVDEFQVVFRRVEGLDDILVRIDPAPSLSSGEREGLVNALGEDLRLGLGIRVSVEVVEPGSLPRWDHKARRVKDERTEVPF